MSKKNTKKEQENIQDGQEKLPLEEKLEALSKSVFKSNALYGNALDMMYLQLITIIEILAENGILTPEKFEEKLQSVSNSMQERIKEKMNDQSGASGQNNVSDPDRPDASSGSEEIITPSSRIIIPGQ